MNGFYELTESQLSEIGKVNWLGKCLINIFKTLAFVFCGIITPIMVILLVLDFITFRQNYCAKAWQSLLDFVWRES